jgi:hypothetical protein
MRAVRKSRKQIEREYEERRVIWEADNRRRQMELIKEIHRMHNRAASGLRRRSIVLFQFLGVLTMAVAVAMSVLTRAEIKAHLSSFHNVCSSVNDGDPVGELRELASERHLIFVLDENLTTRHDEEVYVLKPEKDWPNRLGCHYLSHQARLYRLRGE